jgi:hypothetical protein
MVKSTLIARVADGLALAASMDDEEVNDLNEYKNQAKLLFKSLSSNAEKRCSLDSPPYVFQYKRTNKLFNRIWSVLLEYLRTFLSKETGISIS